MRTMWIVIIIMMFVLPANAFAKAVKRYYPDGTVQAVVSYNERNQMHGPYKYYWPNGRLKEKGRNRYGITVGKPKKYNMEGKLQTR